jgi:fucose 4-O-acetylase-like acetyltransferase
VELNSEEPAAIIFRFKVIWFIIISGYVGNDERLSLERFTAKWEGKNMDL